MTNADVEARALRAAGTPITLLDGREVRLIFDLDAIAQIEDDFGSLGGMQDTLMKIEEQGAKSQFFKPVLQMMRAALLHDPSAANARFDTALIGEYFQAVMRATKLSFPKDERVSPTATVPTGTTTHDSPGIPSITQSPSASVEPISNFGG